MQTWLLGSARISRNVPSGANSEIEAFTQTQESAIADTDPQKAKYLNNREEMNQALTNFTDAHTSLITNKDDYMTNQSLAANPSWGLPGEFWQCTAKLNLPNPQTLNPQT